MRPLRVPHGADPWVNMPTCAKPQIVDSSPPDCHLPRCCGAEIGDALSAFEQQRQQNSSLLQQLTERDAALNALRGEKLVVQQQLEQLTEQVGVGVLFDCVFVVVLSVKHVCMCVGCTSRQFQLASL